KAPTAIMTKAPVNAAPAMLCAYCQIAHGFNTSDQKLCRVALPSGWMVYPTGCCIQASVATMNYPDSHEPKKTMNAENQCMVRLRRFSPYRKRPRNADSMKNANTPSMANVCPITPPAKREKCDQLVPNWNSMGMPVTTPMTKLMPNIFAQNRAARS